MNRKVKLNREQVAAFQAEIDAVRAEVVADLGERDAQHIRRMIRIARGSAAAGRGLLMFGFGPLSWLAGVGALAHAKILENMEIGHNVMHGQYDWMNDPRLNSQQYDWDTVCTAEDWRHSHNVMHHRYTNILGKDEDLGYGILRMTAEEPWKPRHLLNPVNNAILAVFFQYGVGMHDSGIAHITRADAAERRAILRRLKPFARKLARQWFKDYAFFPALALWNAPRVLVGNLAANLIRNLWAYAIIFCGHFPEGTQVYTEEETANETRGDWYLRQLQGSANFEGRRWLHILSGHLSHQIEHHLFPDIPAHRYIEMAPKVRAICEKYGIAYNTGSFGRQFGTVMRSVFRHALPSKPRSLEPVLA